MKGQAVMVVWRRYVSVVIVLVLVFVQRIASQLSEYFYAGRDCHTALHQESALHTSAANTVIEGLR